MLEFSSLTGKDLQNMLSVFTQCNHIHLTDITVVQSLVKSEVRRREKRQNKLEKSKTMKSPTTEIHYCPECNSKPPLWQLNYRSNGMYIDWCWKCGYSRMVK